MAGTLAVALVTLLAGITQPVPAAEAQSSGVDRLATAAVECEGRVATVVGGQDQPDLIGTSGPDVIVTNGSRFVLAGEGEDLVCMTVADVEVVLDGYDEYDENGSWSSDRVIGTGNNDTVSSGGYEDITDFDPSTENTDEFVLGSGDSTALISGTPVGLLDAGTGRDRIVVEGRGTEDRGHLTVDVARKTLQFAGQTAARLRGFESFRLSPSRYGHLIFRGSAAAESVYLVQGPYEFGTTPRTVKVTLGPGNDRIEATPHSAGFIAGGTGSNEFRYAGGQSDGLPTTGGVVRATLLRTKVTSFNRFAVSAARVQLTGSADRDIVNVSACQAGITGLAGNDKLNVERQTFNHCGRLPQRRVMNGGKGADSLTGSQGADVLLGGPGTDVAIGRNGIDTCAAERTNTCERRP